MNKINKTQARIAYTTGKSVYLLPNKTRLGNAWIQPFKIYKATSEDDFDKMVNAYEYYNCNSELGTRCAYYVE